MEYKKFKELLGIAGLSVKEFSRLSNTPYSTCNNWTTSVTAPWVESWIKLYIENKKLSEIKNIAIEIAKY